MKIISLLFVTTSFLLSGCINFPSDDITPPSYALRHDNPNYRP